MKASEAIKMVEGYIWDLSEGEPSVADTQLANLLTYCVLTSPYFTKTFEESVVLLQNRTNFIQVGWIENGHENFLDPFKDIYDTIDFYEEPSYVIELPPTCVSASTPLKERVVQWDDVPSELKSEALYHVDLLKGHAKYIEAAHKLFHPTETDFAKKNELVFELLNADTVDTKVSQILGPECDYSLGLYGIKYHHTNRRHSLSKCQDYFWLAHNGHEIAGVLGAMRMSDEDDFLRLSYVSVAHGFRNQGLSQKLLTMGMDFAEKNHWIWKRSSPGKMTTENPNISKRFDQCTINHRVPHLSENASILEMPLSELRRELPWETFCQIAKPICDEFLAKNPAVETQWSISAMDKKRALSAIAEHLPEELRNEFKSKSF